MRARLLALPVLLALGMACQSSPPPASRVPAAATDRARAFEAQRAWKHLSALAEIGPRAMGTEGGRRAGDFILGELAKLDLELFEQEITATPEGEEASIAIRNIAAKIAGPSSDIFLLAAPYDTRRYENFRFLGVNDGGSGAALLLEIARVLAADPLPYTTWLIFLDGEAPRAPSSDAVAPPSHFGSRGLVKRLHEKQLIDGIRFALVVNRVCDADLRIARDLHSNRIYREEFWRAAARLGRSDAFPPGASFESPMDSHYALVMAGLQRVVALVDTSFGGDEPPGLYAGTEDDDLDHCSAESLDAVGKVTLEALDTISRRLAKIDRFAESPLEATGELTFEPPAPPEAGDTAISQAGGDQANPKTGDEALAPRTEDEAPAPPTEDEAPAPSAAEADDEPREATAEGAAASPEAPEEPR